MKILETLGKKITSKISIGVLGSGSNSILCLLETAQFWKYDWQRLYRKGAQMEMNMIAEGYHATEPVYKLNKSIGNNSPIIDTVYGILFLNKSPKKSFQKLSKKLT